MGSTPAYFFHTGINLRTSVPLPRHDSAMHGACLLRHRCALWCLQRHADTSESSR
jgi:hypothetical protein